MTKAQIARLIFAGIWFFMAGWMVWLAILSTGNEGEAQILAPLNGGMAFLYLFVAGTLVYTCIKSDLTKGDQEK